MDAILKLMGYKDGLAALAGSTIYISRITRQGTGLAKPCKKCMDLIQSVGISRVVYTTETNEVKTIKL